MYLVTIQLHFGSNQLSTILVMSVQVQSYMNLLFTKNLEDELSRLYKHFDMEAKYTHRIKEVAIKEIDQTARYHYT